MDDKLYASYGNAILVLVFLTGIMVAVLWLLRRFGLVSAIHPTPAKALRRMSVIETLPLDGRRRLVLIRRDGVEHLLLLGPTGEGVVETGIAATLQTTLPEGP